MNLSEFTDIYFLISDFNDFKIRKESFDLRKRALKSLFEPKMIKVAFDTRRINQETDYIPRRGLQNYHRSAEFISEATSQKIKNFVKLKKVLDQLKEEFGKQPEWQDSYARVLLNSIDRAIRFEQKDGDYAETQPGVGSLDYLEELLHVRYRLDMNIIKDKSENELKNILLSRDESLIKRDVDTNNVEISKREVATQGYDSLLEKLFGGVKADKDNKSVQRSITITIKDDYLGD